MTLRDMVELTWPHTKCGRSLVSGGRQEELIKALEERETAWIDRIDALQKFVDASTRLHLEMGDSRNKLNIELKKIKER